MQWNPDQIDLFKALYLAETPATQIASQFNISKRRVYTRASELGISRSYKPVIPSRPVVSRYEPKIGVRSLLDLKHDQGHFIIGNPKADYGYCGKKVHKGSYCKQCASVIYAA